MSALTIVGSIFILVAALIHLMIFFMESVLWSRPAIWRRFGLKSQEHADIAQPMAFNQGFYNVFLAVGAGAGLVLLGSESLAQAGLALSIFAAASMVLAATVLIVSSPKLARAAVIQGLAPLIGIILLVLSIVAT